MSEAPDRVKVKLIGQNGNVFNLLAICVREAKRAGRKDLAEEVKKRVTASGSYDEALRVMMELFDVE